MLEVDLYTVKLRFSRLFADPLVFDEPGTLPQRYIVSAGVPRDKANHLRLSSGDVAPVDDSGRPSAVAGRANYRYLGKWARCEYMKDANLEFEYADFGSGLSQEDHRRVWEKAVWGEIRFKLKEFQHKKASINLPDVADLYQMLRARADPSTMASVELMGISENLFHATVWYMEQTLKQLAEHEGRTVEVYAAKSLRPDERMAIEKRLGRESTDSTVHVILSKRTGDDGGSRLIGKSPIS